MFYELEAFVRELRRDHFVVSPCVNPDHEPWALITEWIPDGRTLNTNWKSGVFFITDGINVMRMRTAGLDAFRSDPSGTLVTPEERQKVLEAFAKGMLNG